MDFCGLLDIMFHAIRILKTLPSYCCYEVWVKITIMVCRPVEVHFSTVSGGAMYRTRLTSVAKVFSIFQITDIVGIN